MCSITFNADLTQFFLLPVEPHSSSSKLPVDVGGDTRPADGLRCLKSKVPDWSKAKSSVRIVSSAAVRLAVASFFFAAFTGSSQQTPLLSAFVITKKAKNADWFPKAKTD